LFGDELTQVGRTLFFPLSQVGMKASED